LKLSKNGESLVVKNENIFKVLDVGFLLMLTWWEYVDVYFFIFGWCLQALDTNAKNNFFDSSLYWKLDYNTSL